MNVFEIFSLFSYLDQPPVHVALAASFTQSSTVEGEHTEDEEANEDPQRSGSRRVLNPTSSRKSMRTRREDEPIDVDRDVPIERNEEPFIKCE